MNKSRFEADVRKKGKEQLDKHGISIDKTNLYSLSAILSTFIVTLYFLYKLYCFSPQAIKNEHDNELNDKISSKIELDSTQIIKVTNEQSKRFPKKK